MKNVFDSIKELCWHLIKNNFNHLFNGFFALSAIEAGFAMAYLALLQTDPKNTVIFGFSSQRIILLSGIFVYFLIMGLLSIINKEKPAFYSNLIAAIKNKPRMIIILSLIVSSIALMLFSSPETGLRGKYQSFFEKLDPIFVLIFLFGFQLVFLICIIYWSNISPEERKTSKDLLYKYLIPFVVFLFPFVFFFPRTIPISGEFTGISNDFIPTSYSYKFYLLDNLSQLHLPLWSPSEAAGFPFFSNPLAQVFYPFNIPLTGLYILNGGYSILDHQRFAVLGIAIFALGLFFWLKQFRLSTRSVFITALLIPVTYRLAELIRYPSGVHSAAWYPWILYSITKLNTSTSIKKSIGFALIFVFSCFCLVTGGYQYYLYYSMFLVIPYLLILWIPWLRKQFFSETMVFQKRNLFTLALLGGLTVLITAPYLLKMANLFSSMTGRGGDDFAFSTSNNFNFLDTLGSLVYPPSSQTEGWYYFGFPILVLICLYLFSHQFIRSQTWASNDRGKTWNFWYLNPWVKILLVAFIVIISYISYGNESYLFIFLWQYLPYFSHLRFLGRINIVLIPVIALLLAIALDFITNLLKESNNHLKQKNAVIQWCLLISAIYFLLLVIQMYLIQSGEIDRYWETYFYMFSNQKFLFVLSGVGTFIFFIVTGYLFSKSKFKTSKSFSFWMVLFFVISVLDLWHIGAYMWWAGTIKTSEDTRRIAHISDRVLKESLDYKRSDAFIPTSVMLTPVYNVGFGYDWDYERYKLFFQDHQFEVNARQELLGVTNPNRIFFTQSIVHATISDFLSDSHKQVFSYEIIEFTGEKLKIQVNSQESGFVSYIDNWDSDWKAYVNDREVPIHLLFSTFKSVKVEKGISEIVFSYEPNLFSIIQ